MSVPCPECGAVSAVKDSRPVAGSIRRRRVCNGCGERWTTYEIPASSMVAFVELQAMSSDLRDLSGRIGSLSDMAKAMVDDLSLTDMPGLHQIPRVKPAREPFDSERALPPAPTVPPGVDLRLRIQDAQEKGMTLREAAIHVGCSFAQAEAAIAPWLRREDAA